MTNGIVEASVVGVFLFVAIMSLLIGFMRYVRRTTRRPRSTPPAAPQGQSVRNISRVPTDPARYPDWPEAA